MRTQRSVMPWIYFAMLLAGLGGLTKLHAEPTAGQPNVLMIAIDDLNDWIGCLGGHPQALTPNIDQLASRGVLFANAHCASPACNPSRAAIFSGRMPWKTGVWSNDSKKLFQLEPAVKVIPRAFHEAGYRTFGTGKLMHSGEAANRQMFDAHFNVEQRWSPLTKQSVAYTEEELPTKGTQNPIHTLQLQGTEIVLPLNRMPSDRNPQSRDGESFDWGPFDVADADMGDTQITDWAMEQLKAPSEQPTLLCVGYYRPHIPLWAPKKYFERFQGTEIQLPTHLADDLEDLSPSGKRWALEAITAGSHQTVIAHDQWKEAVKSYLACTSFVDAQIGRLIEALQQSSYRDNTWIVLWSDHGWHLGEKQHWGKWTGWERSTRVPLIVVPPLQAGQAYARGITIDQPVSLIDLYPTLTELCQLPAPDDLDGLSLVPLLHGQTHPDTTPAANRRIVTSFDAGNVSLRSQGWRYIRYRDGSEELYDLTKDPHEWTNLIRQTQFQRVIEEMRAAIPAEAL
ncbi:MAG: sulfatase [bacterium]|nr:sulfatase [bacterium]